MNGGGVVTGGGPWRGWSHGGPSWSGEPMQRGVAMRGWRQHHGRGHGGVGPAQGAGPGEGQGEGHNRGGARAWVELGWEEGWGQHKGPALTPLRLPRSLTQCSSLSRS